MGGVSGSPGQYKRAEKMPVELMVSIVTVFFVRNPIERFEPLLHYR